MDEVGVYDILVESLPPQTFGEAVAHLLEMKTERWGLSISLLRTDQTHHLFERAKHR
jgi:hypothetical protein